jgi:hypothetical protein
MNESRIETTTAYDNKQKTTEVEMREKKLKLQ